MNKLSFDIHADQPVLYHGAALEEAEQAMILLHGRGAAAQSILPLSTAFSAENMAYLAPQAGQNRWYPLSFLAPLERNEPDLDLALERLQTLVRDINDAGIPTERIWLAGFSQGACLAAEFAARFPQRYGGLLVFSGGRIGPPGTTWYPTSALKDVPVFIGCSDTDPHIPLLRVQETINFFEQSEAQVVAKIYPDMPHTITEAEIRDAQSLFMR